MRSKKAVEEVIAVVLVVVIVIAVASAFFFWSNRIQAQAQGQAEVSTGIFLNRLGNCIRIPSFSYNLITNKSDAQLQNCGSFNVVIGDGDDNVLITSDGCAFPITETVLERPKIIVGPGAIASFSMNFNLATCSGSSQTAAAILTDQGGQVHKIQLTSGGTAVQASQSFIPERNVVCGVTISEPADKSTNGTFNCINYTITNTGEIPQTFSISGSISPSICGNLTYLDGANCIGSVITQKAIDADSNGNFSVFILLNSPSVMPALSCPITTTVRSTDLATCTDSDSATLIAACGDTIDNDGDGFTDAADSDCYPFGPYNPTDPSESF